MKIVVTLLILAAITVAIVEAQAHARSRPSSGNDKVQRSSGRTAPRNPLRNVSSSKQAHRSKAGSTSLHIKTNNLRNNKPRTPNNARTNKAINNVKPVPKPIAAKPAPMPSSIKKKEIKLNVGQPTNNKPANIVKQTVKLQAKKDADKKKVISVSKNTVIQQKINKNKTVPNVKNNGDGKSAIKNLSEKPSSTTQAEIKTGKKTINGIPVNIGSNQQFNKKPVEDKNVQGTINIKMKNEKSVLNVVAEKKVVSSKDASVSLKGDATLQDGVAPKVSFGIDAAKNGNSANAQLKLVDGKPALDTELRKEFLNGQDESFALKAGANLQKDKKPEYSLGMEGAKGGHSVSVTAKLVDGKPALDTEHRSEFLSGKDESFALKTGVNLQKGEKPEYSFGMEGAKGGHSVSATAKLIDGKPALDTQLRSEFLNGKDGSYALKTGVNLQKDEKPEYFFGLEGTKNENSVNAGVKIVNGKPEFGLGVTIPF